MFVTVEDIPEITREGPRALPSPNGDSVLHIYESNIYELKCNPSKCSWKKWPRRFTSEFKRKRWFHAMYISEDIINCTSKHFSQIQFLNYQYTLQLKKTLITSYCITVKHNFNSI